MLAVLPAAILLVLLDPQSLWAWGPATHLSIAYSVLEELARLKPALYTLLAKHLADYLYGCLSSDIFLGKRFSYSQNHCHNWQVALRILKEATTPGHRAFSLGYLGHLAADTISHNRFVPGQIILTFSSHTVRHVYWEMRYDALVNPQMWQVAKSVVQLARERNNPLLKEVLAKTSLGFATSQGIFNSYLLLGRINRWQRWLRYYSTKSPWHLPPQLMADYHRHSRDKALEIMTKGSKATCLNLDPMGRASLATAKRLRKILRDLCRENGSLLTHELDTLLALLPTLGLSGDEFLHHLDNSFTGKSQEETLSVVGSP